MNCMSAVIPGRREAASPEPIILNAAAYGFRARPFGPSRNDDVKNAEAAQ